MAEVRRTGAAAHTPDGDGGVPVEEARVVAVEFDTAHDSEGLIVVVLAFPNGARSQLRLDTDALRGVVEGLALETISDLVGQTFSAIAPALPANRAATLGTEE